MVVALMKVILRHMRNFYLVYPKCVALRPELSWTHYRLLLKVGNEQARLFTAGNHRLQLEYENA